ncbi:hypothetical protein M0R45_010013 [Rubus argutus]|uniref:Uncharacterized protein n=1 Tax=Rubus argutus TaxID=59490 RepID=A0AAW1Y944_RUBAR
MDDIGKQEGKNMEEGLEIKGPNQTHDHEELEGVQEPNPNSVDGVVVEMQKVAGDSGVEMPSGIEGPVDLAPAVLETPEDAGIGTDPNNEPHANTESDKLVGNVDSDVHRESEASVKIEGDNLVSNVDSDVQCESEVCLKIESGENGEEKGEELKDVKVSEAIPSIELDASAETNDLVGNGDGGSHHTVQTKVPMEIEKVDNDGEEGKALKDGVSSKANPTSELHISAETDNAVSQVDSDMCHDVDVAMGKVTDGVSSKANPSSELHINAETGNAVSQVESDMCHDGDVAMGKLTDGVSSKANPSSELHINAETDNAVSQVESDMCHDGDVAMGKVTDGVSSKANPFSEPLTSAETDRVVCKLEHDMPLDSKVAREKLVYGVSGKAKCSPNEPPSSVKADNVCKVERDMPRDNEVSMETESESDDDDEKGDALTGGVSSKTKLSLHPDIKEQVSKSKFHVGREAGMKSLDPERTFLLDPGADGDESGTEEEQAEFMKEVENFYKERHLEFKAPKFYKEELNLLKLWRAVIKLGGYEKVTSCKLWRQVGESFNPPKTCTTVSWTFRIFYEKALLEFEKHRWHGSELALPAEPSRVEIRADGSQTCGSGRTLRDAAARAMQGWHSQRLFGNGEDKHLSTMPKSDKQLKSSGLLKRKKLSPGDCAAQVTDMKGIKPRLDMTVFDVGPPADWVKINVKRFNDCFEVYALVPGLLREEVHVQSDPVGRLVISGQPMQLDNPWGVTPFKKVVSLPSRIDPHQTSAVVTLNGQLFVRVPFEQSDY